MINLKILQAACDSRFAIKSLQQYARDKKEAYETFVAGLESAVQQESLDEALASFSVQCSANLDSVVYLGNGVQNTIRSTITQIYNGIESYADVNNNEADLNFDVSNPDGTKTISLSDLSASVKDQLYSVAALESACEAQQFENFSDKLNSFKERISSIFSSDYVGSQQTLSYYTNIFRNKMDDVGFLQSIANYIGIENQENASDDDGVAQAIDQSDVSKYTGASPAGPLNFDSLGNAVASTLKVGAQVVGGIFKSVGSFIGGLFKKGAEKIYQVAVDPDDMYVVNEDGDPTFDKLFYQDQSGDERVFSFPESRGYTQERVTAMVDELRKHSGKWIKLDQIYGTLLIRFGSIPNTIYSTNEFSGKVWHFKIYGLIYQFKFKTMRRGSADEILRNASVLIDETKTDLIINGLNNMKNIDLYSSVKDSEVNRLIGLEETARLAHCLANSTYYELFGTKVEGVMAIDGSFNTFQNLIPDNASVTNADFFYYATGLGNGQYPETSTGRIENIRHWVVTVMIYGFALTLLDKRENPLNFSWFPYVNGYENFNPGKWGIKTDAQNREAFNTFFTTAIAVVVIAVATIVIGVSVSRITRKIFFKRQKFISQMDNKMWSGVSLTPTEMRRYVRYSRKNNAMNLLVSGLSTEKANTLTTVAEAAGAMNGGAISDLYSKIESLIK